MSYLPDTPKRFIAGAKCAVCQAVDRVVIFRSGGVQYQECVSCGHQDEMVFQSNFQELESRANRKPEEKQEAEDVVRFIELAVKETA